MAEMSKAQVKNLQHKLNAFAKEFLEDIAPLRVDGDKGQATNKRIRWVKYYLGYVQNHINSGVGPTFWYRLGHPKQHKDKAHRLGNTNARLNIGHDRRVTQRKHAKDNHEQAQHHGVGHFDGRPCSNWLIPYLKWARAHGWDGILVSGWRDPVYSEHLCYAMCGRPICPGRCAGRGSAHSGSDEPHGALDVTFYTQFGRIIRGCPFSPRIFNDLPIDRVHFSSTGH